MRKVRLRRVDYNPEPDILHSYSMELTVLQADDMPKEVFVKQRFGIDATSDVFVAVASPTQLEDLPVHVPGDATSYFRDEKAKLTAANQAALDAIYLEVLGEVELLVSNLNALDDIDGPSRVVDISADGVEPV